MRKLQILVLVLGIMLVVVYFSKKADRKAPDKPWPKDDFPVDKNKPPVPPVPPPKAQTFEEALSSITRANLQKNMDYLCSPALEGRMSGKNGNRVAADYTKRVYESYGLQVVYQKFPIRRINPGPKNEEGDDFSNNVIAWSDGNALQDEIVVVGAHMDHIGYGPSMSSSPGRREIHPGADDNASGTVSLFEIARAFGALKGQHKRTVVFMSFSGEEMGLIGSQYYCNNPLFPKSRPDIQKHIFMLNMDMVGYLGKARQAVSFNNEASSPDIQGIIRDLSSKYAFAGQITGRGGGGSDHAPFYNKRIPVACLHTGMHKNYHTPDDTADKINYDGMEKVARYAFEFAWQVANSSDRPRFNYGGFKMMDTSHDHDKMPFEEREK